MKSGWVTKKLGEVCEINYGTRVRRKDSRSDNYPVYGGGGETFRWETFNRENQCVVSRFAMSPECVRFVSGKFFLNDSGLTVDTASDGLWQDYLDWCLFGKQDIIYALGKGSAQKNLDIREFVNIPIPIPPLAEQKRIVAKIDAAFEKIDKLKANAEKNLANAKELFQSALDEAMRPKEGWVEKRLGEVCCKIGSGATPRGGRASYCQQGISLIRSMNVYDHSFVYSELAHINESQAKELENVTIEPCDVLINITGASVARCCVVPNDVIPARVNQHVSILRIASGSKVSPDFLCYSLVSPTKKRILLEIGEAGSTRQALTKSDLSSFCINIPTIEEQNRIVENVRELAEKIKTIEQNYTQQIADCAEMRQAVLREAFEGRL